MFRVWPGLIAAFLAFAAAAALYAQSVDLPDCNIKSKLVALERGQRDTNFVGCKFADAQTILNRHDYRVVDGPDEAVSGIAPDLITGQRIDGGTFYFSVSRGVGYPPSLATFTILGSPDVIEGDELTFMIHRKGNTAKSRRVMLSYNNRLLVSDAKTYIDVPATEADVPLVLDSQAGPSGDGDRSLTVTISLVDTGAQVGSPDTATALIRDRPLPPTPPPTPPIPDTSYYSIRPDPNSTALRGDPIRFIVERSALKLPREVRYEVYQADDGVEVIEAVPVDSAQTNITVTFPYGELSTVLELAPDRYDQCLDLIGVRLRSEAANPAESSLSLRGEPPDSCPKEPLPWVLICLGIGSLVGLALWKWWRRPTPTPPLPVDITATCRIVSAPVPTWNLGREQIRWPGFTAEVAFEPGATRLPDPLPVKETNDE